MSVLDTILEKRQGGTNSKESLEELVFGVVSGDVPDYQLSAWLMAVYFQGLSPEETGTLTDIMIRSGEVIDLSALPGPLVDKHSTGGVGDKVSLILAPAVAACGVQVPMMSGRGLGHTGGTLDKLESIPGYTTALSPADFSRIVGENGYAMTGQSESIVPADRIMYALRDVTGTVESIPLITASILSKKFAEGASALVFDVKCGSGAFMKTLPDARKLAKSLIASAESLGRPVAASITRMEAPLGNMVGNILEVEESIACLNGAGRQDLMEVTYRLGAWMLVAAGIASSVEDGEARCRRAISDGSAMERFLANVEAQGGDTSKLSAEKIRSLRAPKSETIPAQASGEVTAMDSYLIGRASVALGAGRSRAEDAVDPGAGIELAVKPGDHVRAGDPLCTLYAGDSVDMSPARMRVLEAIRVDGESSGSRGTGSMILEEHNAL
ncbi:MAG: thymidine phosphorylase [Spirochaetales bacterium]